MYYLRELFSRFIRSKPTDVNNLVIFVHVTDWHGHVVVRGDNLATVSLVFTSWRFTNFLEIITKSSFKKLCILLEKFQQKVVQRRHRIAPALL